MIYLSHLRKTTCQANPSNFTSPLVIFNMIEHHGANYWAKALWKLWKTTYSARPNICCLVRLRVDRYEISQAVAFILQNSQRCEDPEKLQHGNWTFGCLPALPPKTRWKLSEKPWIPMRSHHLGINWYWKNMIYLSLFHYPKDQRLFLSPPAFHRKAWSSQLAAAKCSAWTMRPRIWYCVVSFSNPKQPRD